MDDYNDLRDYARMLEDELRELKAENERLRVLLDTVKDKIGDGDVSEAYTLVVEVLNEQSKKDMP